MKIYTLTIGLMVILMQSSTLQSMTSIKRGADWVRTQVAAKWQRVKNEKDSLQLALVCIDTNSCNAEQQAYIKTTFKKMALAIAAAAAACGIYSLIRSKQYESLQEKMTTGRDLAIGFQAADPVLVEDVWRFLNAVKEQDPASEALYDNFIGKIVLVRDKNTLKAIQSMLKRYGPTLPKDNRIQMIATLVDVALRELKQGVQSNVKGKKGKSFSGG